MLRTVFAQMVIILLMALVIAGFDWIAAYSFALGGLVVIVPGAFFAWRLGYEVSSSGQALRSLVMGQIGKLGITVVMFALVFVWVRPLNAVMFFMALVLMMLVNVVVRPVQKAPATRSRCQKA